MLDYKHKYIKYKAKYLQLKGGYGHTYYYHGSPLKLNILKPQSKRTLVVEGDVVVFATNTRWLAIFFIARTSDADIELGFLDGIPYILEQYDGAFDKFLNNQGGYLYYVDPKYFKSDKRLSMLNYEFISYQKVLILKVYTVNNIYDKLKKDGVMLSWEDKERILLN